MSAADGGWEALVGARLEGGRIEEEGKGRGVSGPSPSSRAWDGRLLGAGCSRIGTTSRDCPLRSTMIKHDQARRGGRIYRLLACHVLPSLVSPANPYPIQSSRTQYSRARSQLSSAQLSPNQTDGRALCLCSECTVM